MKYSFIEKLRHKTINAKKWKYTSHTKATFTKSIMYAS